MLQRDAGLELTGGLGASGAGGTAKGQGKPAWKMQEKAWKRGCFEEADVENAIVLFQWQHGSYLPRAEQSLSPVFTPLFTMPP